MMLGLLCSRQETCEIEADDGGIFKAKDIWGVFFFIGGGVGGPSFFSRRFYTL